MGSYASAFLSHVHAPLLELVHVGGSSEEPGKLLDDAAEEHALGGKQRKGVLQVVRERGSEYGVHFGVAGVAERGSEASFEEVEVVLLDHLAK